jgi:subtilisin family serine protease
MISRRTLTSLSVIALGCIGSAVADAQSRDTTFVLQSAGRWSEAQTSAVQASGGVVSFSHGDTGLAVVTSANPNFLREARASKAFSEVSPDRVVEWQKPQMAGQIEADAIPNPPNDTFYPFVQWAPQSVHAPEAWAAGCTGAGVRVAILDGGIHSTHIDLAANLDVGASASFVPGQPFNSDTGTFWHGTHVAGIVAARANGIGTVGIAPEATLVGVKVLHNGSGAFGWIISGILYAATPQVAGGAGADIINMSLGASFNRNDPDARGLVAAMNRAVNFASSRGVLVVSSAGNDGADRDHTGNMVNVPAESGSGIAVAATGPEGFALGATNFRRPASYTNYGNSLVHVAAPGGDFNLPGNDVCALPRATGGTVVNYCWVFDMVMSTVRGTTNSNYGWAAGTSMAAPAASAVAAIIRQANPGISLGALKSRLAQTADDEGKPGNDPYYGAGYVNAYKACTAR